MSSIITLGSASFDEFRFWNKKQTSEAIYQNYLDTVGGGGSTDDYRTELSIYFKFNEGKSGTDSTDRVVLDYSGRIANGYWHNYTAAQRVSGTSFSSESGDPIISSTHSDVIALETEMATSGSIHDANNTMYLYDLVPDWLRRDDGENGELLKKLVQIIASYFDSLYAQIERLPELKDKGYTKPEHKARPFASRLLQDKGFDVSGLLENRTILEFFENRDLNGNMYEKDINEIKNLIYLNIYNNLEHIYKSKGTEKSYRNLLRCFGIDDEIVKLNLYTDNATQHLTDKTKHTSQKTKHIDFDHTDRFGSTVYQQNEISGSKGDKLEKNLALTAEVEVLVPKKPEPRDSFFYVTSFNSSSVFGLDAADSVGLAPSGSNVHDNFQVYLVRDEIGSNRAKWVLEQKNHNAGTTTVVLTSQHYDEIYNNQRWNIAVRVYPEGYPIAGSSYTTTHAPYTIEMYGVSHNLDEVLHEFTLTSALTYEQGSSLLSADKKLYVGARRTNWSGSIEKYSDLKIAGASVYFDKLDDTTIKQHNKDPSNYGHNNVFGNPTLFATSLAGEHIPGQDSLALRWDFQTVTGSDSSGEFIVEDFSSGSSQGQYGWLENVTNTEHKGKGDEFPVSSTAVVSNEFIFASKKELPEISYTADTITIMGDENIHLYEDEDVSDNIFSFEKSMYQSVSEKMLDLFSTIIEYSNLFAKPIDRYRANYKRLEHAKRLFFQRVSNDMDLDRFTEYYKWIDKSISYFLQQLHPASSTFNAGLSDMVESHILERPKYQHLFPTLETKTATEGGIRGINELRYNWKFGHSPAYISQDYNQRSIKIAPTSYLSSPDATVFDSADGVVSISWWMNLGTTGQRREIIRFGTNLSIEVNANDKIQVLGVDSNDGGYEILELNSSIVTNNYNFFVVSFDNSISATKGRIDIYAHNNSSQATTSSVLIDDMNALDSNAFIIGQGSENDVFDEVAVWKKLMTSSDATSLYNSGVSQDLLSHPDTADLVSYYRMGDHPQDPEDQPFKGLTIKDVKSNYNLSIAGIGNTYQSNIAASFAVANSSENIHCLWHKQRQERTGVNADNREKIRLAKTTHISSSAPKFANTDKSLYSGGTYALRNFSKPYSFSGEENRTIHGGTNYATPKNRDFIKPLLTPHGGTSDGAPQNVVLVGTGLGSGLVDPAVCSDVELSPTEKEKFNSTSIVGKFSNFDGSAPVLTGSVGNTAEYAFNIKGEFILPFNLISGSNNSGYNADVYNAFEQDVILANLHSDTTDYTNEIPIQGPFTNQWVGGRQSRHISLNLGTDTHISRPEEWLIVIGEHESLAIVDGAIGLTGPDYGDVYPDPQRKWAIYYRDGRVKRPVNVANIRHTTASQNLGNFQNNYELFNSVGRKENNRHFKTNGDTQQYLANDIKNLPQTTNQIGFLGISTSSVGNTQLNSELGNRTSNDVKELSDWDVGTVTNNSVITTRFSAPGGIETGPAYMDVYSKEFSPYNSLNYRNYTVRGRADTGSAGNSGEANTLRVNSHANRREGLNHLHTRHCGKFGLDSLHGSADQSDYASPPTGGQYEASFHKIHRNSVSTPLNTTSRAISSPSSSFSSLEPYMVAETSVGHLTTGGFSVSFWIRLQNATTTLSRYVYYSNATSGVNNGYSYLQFNGGFLYFAAYDNSNSQSSWRWSVNLEDFLDWKHVAITWDGNFANAPKLYINNGTSVNGTAFLTVGSGTTRATMSKLYIMAHRVGTQDLEGSLQEFAFWKDTLTDSEVSEIYNNGYFYDLANSTVVGDIVDYWRLGEEQELTQFDIGNQITRDSVIMPTVGNNSLITKDNSFLTGGFFMKEFGERRDNFLIQSVLPQSDYNYSWVTSSLGNNYSVRSGKQKVFGFWPNDGMLSSSSGFDSAVTFPTASEIYGS